jgi:hypothetical protein
MEPSHTRRILATTAVVGALALLVLSPAQAYLPIEGDGAGSTSASTFQLRRDPGAAAGGIAYSTSGAVVGNPGDAATAMQAPDVATVASGGSDGIGTSLVVGLAGGALLLLAVGGAIVITTRRNRVALP